MKINILFKHLLIFFKQLNLNHTLKYLIYFLIKGKKIIMPYELKNNTKIYLNVGEFVQFWIFMDDGYESEWIELAKRYSKGATVLDIGAHIGIYSLNLYRTAKTIYAFEPEKNNYNQFIKNVKSNYINNIHVYNKAVSNEKKNSVKLFLSEFNKGLHSLYLRNTNKYQVVNTTTVDSFVRQYKVENIKLIKIDVEGSELDVLKGARITVTKYHPKIIIEINKYRLLASKVQPNEIYNTLSLMGYSCHTFINNSLKQINIKEFSEITNQNVIFISHRFRSK